MSINIADVQRLCRSGFFRWTDHAVKRIIKRAISRADVKQVLQNGEIIEQYPHDYPFPSCLVSGITNDHHHLHVVCGIGEGQLWVISSYRPDSQKWTDNFRKRKES